VFDLVFFYFLFFRRVVVVVVVVVAIAVSDWLMAVVGFLFVDERSERAHREIIKREKEKESNKHTNNG